MREEIRKLFPELAEIHDEGLREKVLDVWVEAVQAGGWKPEDLMQIPFTLLADNVQIMYLEHVRTVCRMCVAHRGPMLSGGGFPGAQRLGDHWTDSSEPNSTDSTAPDRS